MLRFGDAAMIKALVLTGDGINCEIETAFALEQAGAKSDIVHINSLIESPNLLNEYQILALPGGFSFGDEVSSGKILALKLGHAIGEELLRFIESDKLVLGICNGFQALVKLGLLPKTELLMQQVTLTHNRQKRFINRWVSVNTRQGGLFLEGLDHFMLPIRHGEGRLMVPADEEKNMMNALQPHITLVYQDDINGSFLQIAGLMNERGNILGLMPHPEGFIRWSQHPAWTSMADTARSTPPAGLQLFKNMVQSLRN